MFKKILFVFLSASLALSACSTLEVHLDQTPTHGVNSDQVATIVAATVAAIPSATTAPTVTPVPEAPSILPRSLYYLAPDANEKLQIYRLERDGTTKSQITFEQDAVSDFDISPADGAITYFIQNTIITVNQNGKDRHALLEDSSISSKPIWSPDGATIAYGTTSGNTYLYTLATKNTRLLLAGTETDTFSPKQFSPDGRKIIIQAGTKLPTAPEGIGAKQIFDLKTNAMTPIITSGKIVLCKRNTVIWASNNSFFCYNYELVGVDLPGLWRINANDGSAETLLASRTPPLLFVGPPYQDKAGNLDYLYSEYTQGSSRSTFSLMRSDADGVTNRVILRPDTFKIYLALWTPDGSAVVIFQNDDTGRPDNLILVPIDPALPVVTLLANASKLGKILRWGP